MFDYSRQNNLNNGHIIREEDIEKTKPGDLNLDSGSGSGNNNRNESASDIYNSESNQKNNFLNREFFRFFRLPLIIIVLLISAVLVLKFLFFHKSKPAEIRKITKKNTTLSYKKRFSPSVFNYNQKTGVRPDKFKIKFKKETEKLNGKIKFTGGETAQKNTAPPQITKKMVVFIKASYGKNILDNERGVKPAGQNNSLTGGRASAGISAGKADAGALHTILMPQGTVLNAYTKYKIFSYNNSVPVIAILANGYFYGGKAVLKKGDKIFGAVSVKHSLNRLNINFSKIIETSGKSINIDAIAMMPDGSGGVAGDVHNHYAGSILASIAQGVVGAASIFVGGGSGVNSSNPYTFQNQVRENVAQNELNSAQNGINNYADSNQNISITLPAGTPIKIIFLKPLYEK
ncbi:MAG: TrbI/VirB10 family protein [bacterium]